MCSRRAPMCASRRSMKPSTSRVWPPMSSAVFSATWPAMKTSLPVPTSTTVISLKRGPISWRSMCMGLSPDLDGVLGETNSVARGLGMFAVPPAAAKRLQQRGGVLQSLRARLDVGDQRLLARLFGLAHRQRADVAELELAPRDRQRAVSEIERMPRRAFGLGIGLHRLQRVGDVLEGVDHGRAIRRLGLVVGGAGGAFLVLERRAGA